MSDFPTWFDGLQHVIHFGWEAYQHRFGECRDPGLTVEQIEGWTNMDAIETFPHCDARILHKPGECKYCDDHADWQILRHLWGVNYTGHYDPEKMACPAEQSRGIGKVGGEDGWAGNVPTRGRLPDPDEVADTVNHLRKIEQDLM